MIIHESEGKSKENFYERKAVMQRAMKMMEKGEVVCPICGGKMRLHGAYLRRPKDNEGIRHEGWVAQGHCEACDKYHSVIPSFIKPYKQYETEVIEAVLTAVENGEIKRSDCPANESTITRWKAEFAERGARAVGSLRSILYNIYTQHINMIELKKERLMKQLDRLTEMLLGSRRGLVMGRTNIILTRYNSGYL